VNRIYRLIWSERYQALRPVAETARGRRKRSGGRGAALVGGVVAVTYSICAFGTPSIGSALAPNTLPTAPAVTAGQATVATKGNEMTVTESTTTAVINWGSFNIGASAGVTFQQPNSSSVVLNRSLAANPSQIYGNLSSNGILFLINPQGIVVGPGAEVNVGGLVASSLNLSDQDFLAGHYSFSSPGGAAGSVSNAGTINVTGGGFAALIGGRVANTGSISAKLGSVALASGNKVTLDFDDSGLVKVAVDQAALDALVANSGAIIADGGRIVLTARSANDLLGNVVNNTGVLQARTLGAHDGQVWLLAADALSNTGANGAAANAGAVQGAAGAVASSGVIDVSGNGGSAGEATLAGTSVDVSGTIEAGNTTGSAGRVLINSTESSTLESTGLIDVSSGAAGGKAVLWSDGSTSAAGTIDGRGIGPEGAGATVEVSAEHDLSFNATVKLDAPASSLAGTLILDPATLEVAAGSGLGSGNLVYQSTLEAESGNIVLAATGQVTVDALSNNNLNLASASSLTVTSQNSGGIAFLNNAGGTPSGITTQSAPVTLTASGSGSLQNIGQITTNGGNITLSGVYVHLAGGLDATNGVNPAGNVDISVFGGGILSSSTNPIAGAQVLLDGTYGYVGSAVSPVPTATTDLAINTGGNAYVANTGALTTLALSSNHLEGIPVGIDVTASNLALTGADGSGDGTTYAGAVRWTQYSASDPSILITAPTSLTITEDGNLLPGTINLPQTAVSLNSGQGFILGGNTQPVIANTLTLASPLGIGGADFNGINGETDEGNPGAAGGATLLTNAGTITANVIGPSGNITGIVNLTQQGDLAGSVQAQNALLQATGNIGSLAQPFALNLGSGGEAYNIAAGGNVNLDANFVGYATFDNARAGGTLTMQVTEAGQGNGAAFNQVFANGDLTLTGVQNSYMSVGAATSTLGSIAITNDSDVVVSAATLNGTDAANRSIDVTSNFGNVIFGQLSTNGSVLTPATAAPAGSINLSALEGSIWDTLGAYYNEYPVSPGVSVLRAGNVSLVALNQITMNYTAVDTYANLTLTAGAPGSLSGDFSDSTKLPLSDGGPGSKSAEISASLLGIDSVNDPQGEVPHSIHVATATAYAGGVAIQNRNGDLQIGSVRSYNDYGDGDSDPGSISLQASGSIVSDGTLGGGTINASDLTGAGGQIILNAGGSLGQRGTGSDGTAGATDLSLSGSRLGLTTGGDLFVNNSENYVSLNLELAYASSTTPYFYHFISEDTAQAQANTPAVTFNAGSSNGLLTETSGSMDDGGSSVSLSGDGDIRIESFQAGQNTFLGIYGQNITVDAPVDNTPALSMGDSSSLEIQAQGSLSVGNIASTSTSLGNSSVDLEAYGGNLTLNEINAALALVTVQATGGDIVAAGTGNQLLAGNLTLTNSLGAIGANPAVSGSVPINIGVSNTLSINNEGGGGSINLVTLNDPASLILTLATPTSGSYAGGNFSIAPQGVGLGLTGTDNMTGITLTTLGTTGTNPAAVPVSIVADTPGITIASGAGSQLGIGYTLSFGTSYSSVVTNLAGSAGQNVVVQTNNSNGTSTSLTGAIALTDLELDTALYSGNNPLTVDWTLAQPLSAFKVVRTGNDNDPASFNGNTITLTGSGESISLVEASGALGAAPGTMTVNATSSAPLSLEVALQTAGIIDVGTVDLGQQGALMLSATSTIGGAYSSYSSAILGGSNSNSITAGTVNLTATNANAGQATIGTSDAPVNIAGGAVSLTTSGDLYASTGSGVTALSVTTSHPGWVNSGINNTYEVTGTSNLSITDDVSTVTQTVNLAAMTPLAFSFTTDAAIQVGSINAGSTGSVNLTANGSYGDSQYLTPIAITQGTGSGITAQTVNLTAMGYGGNIGTSMTALSVAAPNLSISSNSNINVADTVALQALSLDLSHSFNRADDYTPANTYSITAPSLTFTLNDNFGGYWSNIQIANLSSSTLQTFSLNTTDANISIGQYNGSTSDYTGGQISLGSTSTVNLTSSGNIWQVAGYGIAPTLSDQAGSAVAPTQAVIQVGTLNLNAVNGNVAYSGGGYYTNAEGSMPIEVTNVNVTASGTALLTNIGNLNVAANVDGLAYFRAVEANPGVAASITGGTTDAPITAGSLSLVAFYGSIGTASTPVVANTPSLDLESGANINAVSETSLTSLSINSDHNKASIGDTSDGGLNSISVVDTGLVPLQLGITDLGIGGGYQLTGMTQPQLQFSFETDNDISVGQLTAAYISLTADAGSIFHIPSGGTITADNVNLTAQTAGQSVGTAGQYIAVDSPNLSVWTGGNLYVSDSATLDSFSFSIGSVGDLGSTPTYSLDNSAASAPLTFTASADTFNNVLDINSITTSRTDAPVAINVFAYYSAVGVDQIASNGGTVEVHSLANNVFGLGGSPHGISANTVYLTSNYGSVGDDSNGAAAPVVVFANDVNVTTAGDLRITSPQAIEDLSLAQNTPSLAPGSTWSVQASGFSLSGTADGIGQLDLTSVTGTTTNLSVASATNLLLGTLSLGSGSLSLGDAQGVPISVDGDGSNGVNPNITTSGAVSIGAQNGIGASTTIDTDIAGTLALSTTWGAISVDQISATPLVLSSVSDYFYSGGPISVTAVSSITLTNNLSGSGAVSLTAGGDIDFEGVNGVNIGANGAPVSLMAGGSINGSNGSVSGGSTISLTASGVATGSNGTLSLSSIDGCWCSAASGAITLQAAGDINISGELASATSVSITSTNGSIYDQNGNAFSLTPSVTLSAFGDIGAGSSVSVTPLTLNGALRDSPGQNAGAALTLSAEGGGVVALAADSAVDATHLVGGQGVYLSVHADGNTATQNLDFGQVASSSGTVTLQTQQGDIQAIDGLSTISAQGAINLLAAENPYVVSINGNFANTLTSTAFSLGTSTTPLQLSAPQINLVANGDIYATVPSTGVTGLSIGRTYVDAGSLSAPIPQSTLMPAGTILVTDGTANDVVNIADGGWDSGGISTLNANYGTALNVAYQADNAIELGTITLSGGNLALRETSPFNVAITSTGGLVEANALSFNLDAIDSATGGFGTASSPIPTQITSLSGSTVGSTAGIYMDQNGPITLANVSTGSDISVTTTRLSGAPSANANILIGNVTSNGGAVTLNADGAIEVANGISSPNIAANGPSGDGDVSLSAAAGINLPSVNISSVSGNVNLSASAGDIVLPLSNISSSSGNISITATAGAVSMASSGLNASGDVTVEAGATGVDFTAAGIVSGGQTTLTADQGDLVFGSISSNGPVALTATMGAIEGTPAVQNLQNLPNGITGSSDVSLIAATGIGSAELPVTVNTAAGGATITANTTVSGDVDLVTGAPGVGNNVVLEVNSAGAVSVQNYYPFILLDNLASQGDILFTQQNYYGQVQLNNLTAAPGSMIKVVAPYGDISSVDTSGVVSGSRIVLNALGDGSGGTIGAFAAPVNVDSNVVIAVASGNIALNSVSTAATVMPLVASNGSIPTLSLMSAGDFLVGQIVAGQQGTVNITSAGNIFDGGDDTTRIYAGTVNLTAADAIGTAETPIPLSAVMYSYSTGAVLPGTISANSTAAGNIYLDQQGDAILQSLLTANGSINVTIEDPAHGQSQLVLADSSSLDQTGNDVNVTVTQGDLTVSQANAGLTSGTVNIDTPLGSIYGDGRTNCCAIPNISGNTVNLTAENNVGTVTDLTTLSGTPVGVLANQSTITTSEIGSQINIQYVGNATVGNSTANVVTAQGTGAQVVLQACGNLTVDGLYLPTASIALNAGTDVTSGLGGSVLDGINGGASQLTPDVSGMSVTVGAATSAGNAGDALWVSAPIINAAVGTGGVWINSAAATPVMFGTVTTGGGPVVVTGQGDVLVDSVNSGAGSTTVGSANGAVLDGNGGGSNSSQPNVTAGAVTVNAQSNAGSASDALWVDASTITASAASGGVWINSASTTPVTLTSVTTNGGAVVIGGQGDLLVNSVNSGAGSTMLTSADGAVLDGNTNGSSANQPNVTAGAVTINSPGNQGSLIDTLWVDTPTLAAASTSGGIWINNASTALSTVTSVTTNGAPIVLGSEGDMVVQTVNAGTGSATLTSFGGSVLDGIENGSSASQPNVTAGTATINAANSAGNPNDALWVDAATINGSATSGGVWINSVDTTPVTIGTLTTGGGPVVIGGQGDLLVNSINSGAGSTTLTSANGAVLDGNTNGSSASQPNVTAGAVAINSPGNQGSLIDTLWVDTPTLAAASTSGGIWINNASTMPATVTSVTTNGGAIVLGSEGDMVVQTVNAGTGSATLTSFGGSVVDGITNGSSANQPNVSAGTATINAANSAGNPNDALWVDAATINGSATSGGVWINSVDTTPVTIGTVMTGGGPVVIGGQGDLLVNSINSGSGSTTLTSADGAVLDGNTNGSSAIQPNVTAGAVAINSPGNQGSLIDTLWVDTPTLAAASTAGGIWINNATAAPATVTSVTTNGAPIVLGSEGDMVVQTVNAGTGSATLTSFGGSVLDGVTNGSSASQPNVSAGTVTINAGNSAGNPNDALWVDAATINGSATSGGVWINSVDTTPVTIGTMTTGGGPVVIGGQGDLLVNSINSGTGSTTLTSAAGAVLDGNTNGSSASQPNVTAGAVTVNAQSNAGSASDALWVDTSTITASATSGGVWINSASTTPVTLASVTTNGGALVIGGQGDLLVSSINSGAGSTTLTSAAGAVLDGNTNGSSASQPNVTAGAVTVTATTNAGSASDALWVDTSTITASATSGGIWINNASIMPATVTSVTTNGAPIVLGSEGDLVVQSVNAGTGSATLTSFGGSVLDGITNGSSANQPNVSAGTATINAANSAGNPNDALWVDAATINGSATSGGVWINSVDTTPVTIGTMTTGGGPVVIGGQGDLLVNSINSGTGSTTLISAVGAVLDGNTNGSSAIQPNVTAGAVAINSPGNQGSLIDTLWVDTPTLAAASTSGGIWINNASITPATVTSVTTNGAPIVLGSEGDLIVQSVNAGTGSATLTSFGGSVLDGVTNGSSANQPNVSAGTATINAGNSAGNPNDALWVDAATINGSATSGGVWINSVDTTPVTIGTVMTGGGPVVIGGQGDLLVNSINSGSGSTTLTSADGAVLDGNTNGSSAIQPNVTAGTVAINSPGNQGSTTDTLWVDTPTLAAASTSGGIWINNASIMSATVTSVTTSGAPIVLGSEGDLVVQSVNAGTGSATLTSFGGSVLDGITNGSSARQPNVTAGTVTVNAQSNAGNPNDALWVDAATINGSATSGGVWINSVDTTPVTIGTMTTGGGPVVIGGQGDLDVQAVNAGTGSVTLNSATGGVLDGNTNGSSASQPNVTGGLVSVSAATNAGNPSDALWVDASTISGSAATGGVWINSAATTPVTVASVTTGGGPVVIGGTGNLLIDSVNSGTGTTTLSSSAGAVEDGTSGGSSSTSPNITASTVTVDSATSAGSSSNALWVDTSTINAAATTGGVWINSAATTPVTVSSVTTNGGAVAIGGQGNLLIDSINSGTGSTMLTSAAGAVLDGNPNGSSATQPNVTAGTVTVNSATNAGNSSTALWVDASTINAAASTGGVWINSAATTPVTVASVMTSGGPVVIGGAGNLLIDSVNSGASSTTLSSSTGAVEDGTSGGSNATHPNVTAGMVTVNSATSAGDSGNALWVDASTINAAATTGGVWINSAATTPVTVASVTTNGGAVVIGGRDNLLVDSVNSGTGSTTLSSSAGAVLDGNPNGSSATQPNVTAGTVTVNSSTNAGNSSTALWVDASTINAAASTGGVWINSAATTPVTVASVTTNGGAVVIAGQGDLLIGAVNAGTGSATLSSAGGAVEDGVSGGASSAHPNVTARTFTVDASTDAGDSSGGLWVDASTINAAASTGGVWINSTSASPVTLASLTTGGGDIVVNGKGDLSLVSINAGAGNVTLGSASGSLLDGIPGGSTEDDPNVIAGTTTLTAAKTAGLLSDPLWVSTSYTVTAPGGHWVNVSPVYTPYPALPTLATVSPVTVYAAYASTQTEPPQQLPVTLIGQPVRVAAPIAVTAESFGIALPSGADADATEQDAVMGTASEPISGGNEDEIGRKKKSLRLDQKQTP
jgi:mucin-19